MRTCAVKMFDGKVACPHAGSGVDVETCYRCSRLRAFYDDESGTTVVCAAPSRWFPRVLTRLRAHPVEGRRSR